MIARIRGSWGRFLDWARPSFPDIGTAGLGAAAIFLVRAIPSSNIDEWDIGMLLPVAFFGISGLILRRLGNS